MAYEDNYGESDSGNWNSAKEYSRDKISKLLVDIDMLLEICYFGTVTLPEEFLVDENMKTIARLKAIKRLRQKLRMLIGNTKGVLKTKDRPQFDVWKAELMSIKTVIPMLERNQMRNGRIIRYALDENNYEKILNILENMHEAMIQPLNENNLIFNPKENLDPQKAKEDMKKRMVLSG